MTRQETGAIMDILATAYPRFYSGREAPDPAKTLNLWAAMFAGEPVELVAAAVKCYIAEDDKGYPPHIGAIKNAVYRLQSHAEPDEAEVWERIRRAIANSAYGAAEEFAALPEPLQRLVGSPGQLRDWAMMDSAAVSGVVASNVQRAWRARRESRRREMLLPEEVRRALAGGRERLGERKGKETDDATDMPMPLLDLGR